MKMFENTKDFIPSIHKEGYLIIAIFAFITMMLFSFSDTLGWIGTIGLIWCVFFFRDPVRVTPQVDGFVISPADGIVQMITKAYPPEELEMPLEEMTRISIFLSVFDVHVNRIPVNGKITKLHYRPGKFFNAALDKASVDNERQSVRIQRPSGEEIAVVQIAGLIARRIICDLKDNQEVAAGERFGIIRFGSRTDVYLPTYVIPKVIVGQRAVGGETILADFDSNSPLLKGIAR